MKNKGFTLVELMVSITLILLIFTIAVPTSIKLTQNSRKKQCKEIKDVLLTAVDLYVSDIVANGLVPPSKISLKDLYEKDYIDEEYKIEHNKSIIKKGILKSKNESDIELRIDIKKNGDNENISNFGYYTYELEKDICR